MNEPTAPMRETKQVAVAATVMVEKETRFPIKSADTPGMGFGPAKRNNTTKGKQKPPRKDETTSISPLKDGDVVKLFVEGEERSDYQGKDFIAVISRP